MRGYFGIGAERISKPMNLGAILRTAHAFGASFAFTIRAHHRVSDVRLSDTSKTDSHLPLYHWSSLTDMQLPDGCQLIGVELTDDAVDLPSFRHPLKAAYILGPEKGSISEPIIATCDHVVKIPTKFCVNVSIAAALVMYDRIRTIGGHNERPVSSRS